MVDIDEEYMIPLNFNTYYLDITQAAQNPSTASWKHLHDYIDYYGLPDLSPDSIYNYLAIPVRDNETAAMTYLWNKFRQASIKQPKNCGQTCRTRLFCEMTASEQFDFNVCQGHAAYDFINESVESIANLLTSEWIQKGNPSNV